MLTRTEILASLRKMGCTSVGELKRRCREYEKYISTIGAMPLRKRRLPGPPN